MKRRTTKLISVMRTGLIACCVLLATAGVLLAEHGYGQRFAQKKITVRLEESNLEKALEKIGKVSQVDFTYNNKEVRKVRIHAGSFKEAPLGQVLDALLAPTPYTYRESEESIVIYQKKEKSQAMLPLGHKDQGVALQSPSPTMMVQTIRGKVTDDNKMALPGVNVLLKGTSIGTLTDGEGQFQLELAEQGGTLVFSYIGFVTQELPIGNQSNLSVVLKEDTRSLNEVVVVGYGTQKKANLTGAVSTVDIEKTMESRPVTDVGRALQGAVPGLTITTTTGDLGSSPKIRLRGLVGSLNAGNGAQPLILLDNVEIQSLLLVNPDDIQSISVLKDAASTSIYGSRAAWGVILITSKSGKKNTPNRITYSANFSQSTPTNMPKLAPAAEGAEYALSAARRINPSLTTFGTVGMYFTDESIQKIRDWETQYGGQKLSDEMVLGRDFEIKDGRLYFYRTWDAGKMYMRNWAPQNNHNLGFSGGNDKTSYNVSLGYMGQEGVLKMKTDVFKRYSGTFTINSDLNNWFTLNAKLLLSKNVVEAPFSFGGTTYDPLYYLYRWHAVYPYGTYEGKPFRNAVTEVQQANMNNNTSNFVRATLGGTFKLGKDLTITSNYTYSNTNDHYREVGGSVTSWNQWNGVPLKYESYTSASYDRVRYNSSWDEMHTFKAFGTYVKDINQHAFKVLAGMDVDLFKNWSQSSERRDLLDMNLGELSLATGDQYAGGSRGHWATQGYFARVNYTFADKLLLEANGRYDGSSFFPSGSQWAFFPSVSAGYILTKESFMDFSKPVLDNLKIRASWGSLGNTDVGSTTFRPTMGSSGSNWWVGSSNMLTVSTPSLVPPSLTWEKISTLDFGVDASLFKNRLNVTYDWYQRTTSNMITGGVVLPTSFGASAPRRNYGEMQTTGWEVSVDYKHSLSNGLNFSLGLSFSDFQEKITKFDGNLVNGNYEGKTLGEIWGYRTDRFFTKDDFQQNADGSLATDASGRYIMNDGVPTQSKHETGTFYYGPGDVKYKDLNGDGTIFTGSSSLDDHGDLTVIGNTTPRYQYGVRLGADWKGFDLNAFVQGVGKRDLWAAGSIFIPGNNPSDAMYAHQMDYWTPENLDAYYPRPANTGQSNNAQNFRIQDRYLLNMAYLRFKSVNFGYRVPARLLEKIKVQNLRIYINGENLFEIDHLKVPIDPEVDYRTPSIASATFGRVYPYRRTVSMGLQLTL
ncbi:TonB-linked SusC/RagA family outer membrane protein [Dyadobacter jejuensis]|uniref:TonB-linked SusC/RagA family outer membrane protein n=1 Tax=Dyadobacter jejuensis TaxID=1082580 RepID=A0A316AIX6_9BACT|nr:TonB-dependent receptor [Dyadobacter jejuensis]PWJ57755.1 TonB-linked SusC/RagA family outer membrane protein [Dyadobacter jejuensis]